MLIAEWRVFLCIDIAGDDIAIEIYTTPENTPYKVRGVMCVRVRACV